MVWPVAERGSTRNGNKDGWELDCSEGAQIAARYEVWNSVVAVQRWWRTVKGRYATIGQETIKNCHSKLLTTGSVTDARKSGRPSASRSEENVTLVRDMLTRSPRKFNKLGCQRNGIIEAHCRYGVKEDLNFRPRS